jgi:hypothetical protein
VGEGSISHDDRGQFGMITDMLRHHLFQPPVLVFQLEELLHIADFEPGTFRPPLIEGGIRDAVPAAELGDSDARLGSLEYRNDLFLRVLFAYHGPLLWSPSLPK